MYQAIALIVLTLLSFAGIIWYLENWRRTVVWYINDQCDFPGNERYNSEDSKWRMKHGFFRPTFKDAEGDGASGMLALTSLFIGYIVLSFVFAHLWPLSIPIGLVAGWAIFEKKRRGAKKKTKEDRIKEVEKELEELKRL